ncbi:hypothetical protein E8E13_008653 [Curvularia kusanoi]|uniref:Uncharacterized protein n=1 Tax=Curvularia kusanoi TaxID=90978 RepID=A0A9P4TD59_CURKU|nr:hypothetical protein E8E13_008653 [Curvularia kusanoi]
MTSSATMSPASSDITSLYRKSLALIRRALEAILPVAGTPSNTGSSPGLAGNQNEKSDIKSASQGSMSEQSLHTRASQELGLIALALISWIVPVLLMLGAIVVISILYRKRYANGILAGAALTGGIYASIDSNPSTPFPLLSAVIVDYLMFHITYCYIITSTLRLSNLFAEFFVTATAVITVVTMTLLSFNLGLAKLWHDSTGLAGVWSFFPIHLATFFLSAMTTKATRKFLPMVTFVHRQDTQPILPLHNQDVSNAMSTSRDDTAAESHRRIMPESSSVQ